jgi:UPF0042 nucleotide-binding protein
VAEDAQVIVVTGMSGAGRSQAAKVLEDNGYFVIDNLPSALIGEVVDRIGVPETRSMVAVVVDTRGKLTFDDLDAAINGLRSRGVRTTVLFLDADDATLARRFEETRRSHPVGQGDLSEKIRFERAAFEEIRGASDVIIDTSELNVHELRRRIEEAFRSDRPQRRMRVDVVSFGFKKGNPRVADLMFDVRFLPNPHWEDSLRPFTGLDQPVRDFVFGSEDAQAFMEHVYSLLGFLLPRYEAEGKSYLTIGVGCTGGRHRSVAISEAIGAWLEERGVDVSVRHRDTPARPESGDGV